MQPGRNDNILFSKTKTAKLFFITSQTPPFLRPTTRKNRVKRLFSLSASRRNVAIMAFRIATHPGRVSGKAYCPFYTKLSIHEQFFLKNIFICSSRYACFNYNPISTVNATFKQNVRQSHSFYSRYENLLHWSLCPNLNPRAVGIIRVRRTEKMTNSCQPRGSFF